MKFKYLSTGLMALALLAMPMAGLTIGAVPAVAQDAGIPADVAALLGDTRPLSSLSLEDLRNRLKTIRTYLKNSAISKDTEKQLRQMAKATQDEIKSRRNNNQAADAGSSGAASAVAPGQQDSSSQQTASNDAVPADVAALLADIRAPSVLTDQELRQRLRAANGFLKNRKLPADTLKQLREMANAARSELQSRQKGSQTTDNSSGGAASSVAPDQQSDNQAGSATTPTTPLPAAATAFLADTRDAASLSADELKKRIRLGSALLNNPQIKGDAQNQIRLRVRADRAALEQMTASGNQSGGTTGGAAANTAPSQNSATNSATPTVDPAAETKAKAILADQTPAASLPNAKLRDRLNAIRTLLAANNLSQTTENALRQKLLADRTVLRSRINQQAGTGGGGAATAPGTSGAGTAGGATTGGSTSTGGGTVNNINIKIVLADRRPSDSLRDDELRTRIDVYRDAVLDPRYSQSDRDIWRAQMSRDRLIMRQRLIAARQTRANALRGETFNIQLGMQFQPGRHVPRDVFAAEVDDQQLEDVLAAPPLMPVKRRYTLNEIENSPDLRDAMPHIEVDTIHFGFGESFVREEEIDNLDRIAEIMERILSRHPHEVFIIEGHTDAVGSDQSNLELSRLRAEAVKQALVTYYVIPPENLVTVGYGERYLKIPTLDPEPENRRVSIARATPLLGEIGQ
jgi:outer membrane protein OmpA-like peptidoglycan-associated protein